MELFTPLDPEKVDELGGNDYLGLPQSEIDRIQKDYQSPTQRKEAYLDLYVHQHPCPTWSKVAEVLRRRVNLPEQANLVENTYVKGTHCGETIVCTSVFNADRL
jgi:Tfp pilus assembly protein PilN